MPHAAALLALALLTAPAALSGQEPQHCAGDAAPVCAVAEGFASALARGDSAAALAYLHPDLRVFESGDAETIGHYREHHLGADIAFLRQVRSRKLSAHTLVKDGMALYEAESETEGTVRGGALHLRGTETIVLVQTADGWKIRHIHWSSHAVRDVRKT